MESIDENGQISSMGKNYRIIPIAERYKLREKDGLDYKIIDKSKINKVSKEKNGIELSEEDELVR